MSWTDQDFDHDSAERMEKMQKKARPKVDKNFFNAVVAREIKKNRNCGSTLTPFSSEDLPSIPDIVEELKPEKPPPRKKREPAKLFEPRRGRYQELARSKPANQAPESTSNSDTSKLEIKQNVKRNNTRSKGEKYSPESWDSCESCDYKTAELQDNFSSRRSVHYNNNTVKFYNGNRDSFTITKKLSNVECPSLSDAKKISKNDGHLVSNASRDAFDSNSLDLNGDVTSITDHDNLASGSPEIVPGSNLSDSAQLSFFSSDICDLNFIPPPKPALPVVCETSEVFDSVLDSTSLLDNLNLNKDQFQVLEDNLSENQSILPNKVDLQVPEGISTVLGDGTEVLESKTAISSEEDQAYAVQSSVSSDEDQVVDLELIKEITQFLKDLEFKRSMPKDIAEKISNDVKNVLRYYFNGNTVKLYGSYWYDAAITTSNINLSLVTDPPVKNNFLLQMQKTLSKEMNGYKVFPFEEEPNARRSKICFIDHENGISCEIIYLGSTVSQYLKLSDMLKAVCDFDPRIKSLVVSIKIWAEACEINEVESGKLHPVGFILLVLHFLQQLEKPLLPLLDVSSENLGLSKLPDTNESSLGELWLGLLKYYSYKFNWTEYVVTVTDKTPVIKTSKSWNISWIAIEDPVSERNVADNVVQSDTADYITSCFKKSYEYFISAPYDSDSTSSGSDSGSRNIRRDSTFKMSDCISRSPPIFCSDDDSDSENCYIPQRSAVEESYKFSKISETSLKNVNQVLHEAYNGYILPDNQVKGREAFVDDLEKYIMKMYPGAKLKLFGSTANGFAFKRSDLDICMTFHGNYKKNTAAGNILRKLVYHLRRNEDLKNVFGLYSAQIPIIKFNCTFQNWHCDLSFYNVLAVHNSKLLYKYSMMDERCRILGCALKLLTKKTNIADCSLKTLSSYSYILMVIHFLQQVNPPVLPVMPIHDKEVFEKEIDETELQRRGVLHNRNYWFYEDVDQLKKRYLGDERNTSTVGELWLEMLEYYLKFDYERAVSITEKDPVPSESLLRYARLINIEDPFLSKRNLGCIVSEGKAGETRKIFHRARMLFGNDYPFDKTKNMQEHYFSPSNLTGRIMKDIECFACGGFGHETNSCPKADPFKNRKPWKPSRIRTQKSNNFNTRKP